MSHENHPLSAGTRVRAVDFPPTQTAYSQITQANISATSYTLGSPEMAVRFMAPTSGRVLVTVSAGLRNNSATVDRVFVSFRVLEGDPDDADLIQTDEVKNGRSNYAVADAANDYEYGGHTTVVSGLTPGAYYYAQLRHRVTVGGGTADIAFRGISVIPIP